MRERELLKLAGLTTAIADALRKRGMPEPIAALTADCGMTIFRVGFSRWLSARDDRDMAEVIDDVRTELRALTAAAAA